MLNIFAKSIMTATRNPDIQTKDNRDHQGRRSRFDNRTDAEIEAHLVSRRRD